MPSREMTDDRLEKLFETLFRLARSLDRAYNPVDAPLPTDQSVLDRLRHTFEEQFQNIEDCATSGHGTTPYEKTHAGLALLGVLLAPFSIGTLNGIAKEKVCDDPHNDYSMETLRAMEQKLLDMLYFGNITGECGSRWEDKAQKEEEMAASSQGDG